MREPGRAGASKRRTLTMSDRQGRARIARRKRIVALDLAEPARAPLLRWRGRDRSPLHLEIVLAHEVRLEKEQLVWPPLEAETVLGPAHDIRRQPPRIIGQPGNRAA